MRVLTPTLRVLLGISLAGGSSLLLAHLFAGSDQRTLLPLAFIVVLFGLSRYYGMAVAIIGSLLCAFIFAHTLFDPTGSWHVEDFAARRNLLWMVVGTIAISYLFAPSGTKHRS